MGCCISVLYFEYKVILIFRIRHIKTLIVLKWRDRVSECVATAIVFLPFATGV